MEEINFFDESFEDYQQNQSFSFESNTTAINEAVKKTKKSSKNKDSLERPKKKKEKSLKEAFDFQHSESLSLGIISKGEVENTSKWVKSNAKELAELFSLPIETIADPQEILIKNSKKMEVDQTTKSKSKKSSKNQQPIQIQQIQQPIQIQQIQQPMEQDEPKAVAQLTEEELEFKRQIHLACEQTRRKHIKNGLEELKSSLPNCENQKLTKAAILSKAIQFIQQSKRQKEYLASQVASLRQEVQNLKQSCKCSKDCSNSTHNPTLLKQQDKLVEFTPIQPKPIFPQQLNDAPPPYSLPMHANMVTLPEMRFRSNSQYDDDLSSSDSRSIIDDNSDALPIGWEEIMTPDGKLFYINKSAGLSSWVDPRQSKVINVSKTSRSTKKTSPHLPKSQFNFQFQQQEIDFSQFEMPDFMLSDLSSIQFEQPIDSDVKRPFGLGVDIQAFNLN